MTIRHLKIFIAVCECGGMRKASEVLFISQPSISQAIKELENHYNVKLFERLSKRLFITEAGKTLLSYAKHVVNSFEDLEKEMERLGKSKSISIGTSVSVGTCLINDILSKFKDRNKDVQTFVEVNNTSNIENMILSNKIDVGIVEGEIDSKDINIIEIKEDELVVVAGKDHPFFDKPSISCSCLEGENFISRESGSNDRNQFEKFLQNANVSVNKIWCSTNTEAIKNAVIYGNGLAILSKMIIQDEVNLGLLKIISIDNVQIKRQIKLIYHKNKYISETLKSFIDMLVLDKNFI